MSGYVSPFGNASQNFLYDPLQAGRQMAQQNQLALQQQDISGHEIEMGARLANTILDPSVYPTPEARAAAYPSLVANARAQFPGYFKNAPSVYPGDEATRALARMGTPSQTQAEWQFNLAANKAYTDAQNQPATAAAPASSTAPATGGGVAANAGVLRDQLVSTLGVSPVDAGAILSNFHAESGLKAGINEIHPVIPGSRGGYGLAQWTGPRRDALEAFAQQNKLDVSQPDTQIAFMKQELQQPEYAGVLKAMQAAQTPEEKASIFFHGYLSGNAPSLEHNLPGHIARANAYAGLPATQANAAPGTPPPYRVASNAPVPPPASTAPASGQPQPQAQTPQPPANRAMPGGPDGPAAPAPQPSAQAAPAGGPQPPQLAPLSAAGLTPVQQRQIDAMAANPTVPLKERMAAQQAFVNQNIQLQQKAFSDWIQLQQLQTSQGQLTVSQQDLALKYWKEAHPEAKVTLSGGEIITQNPRTGEEIAPRIKVTPNEAPRTVEGTAIEENGQWRQPKPGEQGVPGKWTVGPAGGQFFPEATAPAQAGYKVNEKAYDRNSGQINDIAAKGEAAQADQVRLKEMQDQLERIVTGPGTATKVNMEAWLQRWLPNAVNPFTQQTQGLTDAAAAEVFNKLAFRNATTQERSVAGSRGAGSRMTEMFLQSNPGLDLLTDANRRMLNVMRIANQADIDKTQGAQDHFVKNEQAFRDSNGKTYTSLESYNADWQRQRNPEVFAAAASAAAGLPAQDGEVNGVKFKGWANELNAAEEKRVLEIVARAAPGSRVNTKGGDIIARPQAPATPPMPPGYQPVSQ